jgi:hypothetical protein
MSLKSICSTILGQLNQRATEISRAFLILQASTKLQARTLDEAFDRRRLDSCGFVI